MSYIELFENKKYAEFRNTINGKLAEISEEHVDVIAAEVSEPLLKAQKQVEEAFETPGMRKYKAAKALISRLKAKDKGGDKLSDVDYQKLQKALAFVSSTDRAGAMKKNGGKMPLKEDANSDKRKALHAQVVELRKKRSDLGNSTVGKSPEEKKTIESQRDGIYNQVLRLEKQISDLMESNQDLLLTTEEVEAFADASLEENAGNFTVFRNENNVITDVAVDTLNMGGYKTAAEAEDAIRKLRNATQASKTVYHTGQYFYHILSGRDIEKLSIDDAHKAEDATEVDLGDRDDDMGDYGGDGGMGESFEVTEAKNVVDQLNAIAKSGDGNIKFADGDESSMTSKSAKEILRSVNSKSDANKSKTVSLLSKSYESFMKTLDTLVKEGYELETVIEETKK